MAVALREILAADHARLDELLRNCDDRPGRLCRVAALAALLVPPPSPREIEQLAGILERHNEIEESSDGLYDLVERLAGSELPSVLERVQNFAAIPVAPHSDTPLLRRTIDQLLREAEHGRR